MDSKYEIMVNDPNLYPPEFIIKYGMNEPHWELENWQKRERSLLHDMMCVLLANLEPSQTLEERMISNLKRKHTENVKYFQLAKKRRTSLGIASSTSSIENESESDDNESSEQDDVDIDDFEEYDPIKEFENCHEEILKYRYIVLEGLVNAAEIQSHFVQKWNMIVNKMFDIIDTKERRLIEVKTTTNSSRIIKEYYQQQSTSARTSLIIIELNDNVIAKHNKEDNMPGESKAYNFLIKRKAIMKTLGVEDKETDEFSLQDLVFKSEYLNKTLTNIENLFINHIDDTISLQDVDTSNFKIEPILSKTLFDKLRKPILEDHPEYCTFKGKITPFFMCKPLLLDDDRDLFAVDIFCLDLYTDLTFVKGKYEIFSSLKYLIDRWMECDKSSKNFGFIDISQKGEKNRLPEEVKESLMIGKKGKTYNYNIEDPKQKEREGIENKKYPPWLESLYVALSLDSKIGSAKQPLIEEQSRVPLYSHIGEWMNAFVKKVASRNVGVYIDQISNFYSRISGTYNTTIGNKTTHSQIAAIPLKINVEVDGENQRWMTGVAFRGPHHMRSATDKSNLLIVERIEKLEDLDNTFYKNPTIFKAGDEIYIVRKTAIKKIDGIHLTFIRNSLFIACNMIGDILMRHNNFISEDAFKALCSSHLTNENSLNFFIDRVIDATLMATIGNTRDEGYFSVFRKLFMILINRRRQQNSFTFDVGGLCDKLNECLIDNPLSMFFQNSLLYMICNI